MNICCMCCADEGDEGSEDDEGVCYISLFNVLLENNLQKNYIFHLSVLNKRCCLR